MVSFKKIALYSYIFFTLFAIFFCGSLSLGAITLRNLSGLLFLIVAIFLNRNKFVGDKTCFVFVCYLFVCIMVNVLNGCLLTTPFIRMMLVYQLPSIILLYSLPKLLKSIEEITVVFYIIIILYLINSVITYGESVDDYTCWSIANMVGLETRDEVEDDAFNIFLPGLTGNVVNNGYFAATLLPVVLVGLWSKSKMKSCLSYMGLVWFSYSIIIIQQRMAFLSLIFFVIIMILQKKNKHLLYISVFLLLYSLYNGNILSMTDMGRLSADTEDESRARLFKQFSNFMSSSDFILGGSETYYKKYGGIQHNAFTSAVVIGGIPLFISFLHLCITFITSLFYHYKYSMKNGNVLYRPLCIGCVIYFLYSMTHSEGIQSGGVLFWCLYGLILALDNCSGNKVNCENPIC